MKWTGVVFCSIGLLWGELRVGQFRTLDESRKELQNIGGYSQGSGELAGEAGVGPRWHPGWDRVQEMA